MNINKKKLITPIISFVILAGMAASTLATGVDLTAFVNKEKYMTKYYELNYKIDDITAELERLYKLTCSNVVSFGGSNYTTLFTGRIFARRNYTQSYHWWSCPTIDTMEDKYLRFNFMDALQRMSSPKADTMVKEVPAHLCKWRTGFELKPETKIKTKMTRTVGSGSGMGRAVPYTIEIIMGPFKKVPYVTTTGDAGALMSTQEFVFPGWYNLNWYYAYGTEKEPTSWSSQLGGTLYTSTSTSDASFVRQELRYPIDMENKGYKYDKNAQMTYLYVNSAMTTDISNRTNVWLRCYYSYTGSDLADFTTNDYTITTWNYRK